MRTSARRVLVAHQSTIPYYRVAFYRAVERLRPADWSFAVVLDPDAERARRLFGAAVAMEEIDFPIETARTLSLGSRLRYQTFLRRARDYDLVVLEDAFNNLAYPLARLVRRRRALAYWGHGRDLHATDPGALKRWLEKRKLRWARDAAGYFAYTAGVRDFLVANGVDARRVFVLDNTVDIEAHRRHFETLRESRAALRQRFGAADARLLLYLGRVNDSKRLDLLAGAVALLRRDDPRYRLIVAGGGDAALIDGLRRSLGDEGFDYRGVLTQPSDLAPLFVAADAFVLPGRLGLAPLTALCYDLTPVLIASDTHSPEIEYFDASNAVIAPQGTDDAGYARAIRELLENRERWSGLRSAAWPSISRLTIDHMARSFIRGIDTILGLNGSPEQ